MASQGKNSIIHRKTQGGRLDFDARVMSPAKALRLALAKSADKLFDLILNVSTVEQLVLAHGKLIDEAGNDGLLIVLDGAGGACGAVKFDPQLLAALIEVQTTGIVQAAQAVPRPVTLTDAAMVSPMVNAIMQGFDAELSEATPGHRAQGFRFGDMIEDGRALSLLLDAPGYDLFRLSVDLAEGAKSGMMTLILPVQPQIAEAAQGPGALADAPDGFKGNALDAPVTMDAVVARIRMPLNEICQLTKDSVLPVPGECLSKTELVAAGNHVVSEVLLGQMNGLKAVRFAPSDAEPVANLSEPGPKVELSHDMPMPGGETLEGLAVEVTGSDMGVDMGIQDDGSPDKPPVSKPETVQDLALKDPGKPASEFSNLDSLPQEV